jgi:hypothetical protein
VSAYSSWRRPFEAGMVLKIKQWKRLTREMRCASTQTWAGGTELDVM